MSTTIDLARINSAIVRLRAHGFDAEAEVMIEQAARLATLEATPPPGTVAALLAPVLDLHAQIGDALDGEHRSNLIEALLYALGDARATLGAPTPLDRAVVELVAMDTRGLLRADITIAGMLVQIGEHVAAWEEHPHTARDTLCNIARVALAGMLACDAAKGGAK